MQQHWKGVGRYSTVGLELALSILFGLFAGRWLDGKLDTAPWLTLIGLAYGLAAGFRAVWRAVQRANQEAEEAERKDQEARKKYHDESREP